MKKILAIFLFLIYVGSASGIAVNYHYCGSHLTDIFIINFGNHKSCICNPCQMPKGCCKDKLLFAKADNHKASIFSFSVLPSTYIIDTSLKNTNVLCIKDLRVERNESFYSVKYSSTLPIFLLNNVFRV